MCCPDPAKRNAYHQNIFYPNFHYTHKKKAASPTTAKNILQAVIHLNQQIAGMDPFRFNEEWILAKINELLSDPHLEIIYREQDPELMEKISGRIDSGKPCTTLCLHTKTGNKA